MYIWLGWLYGMQMYIKMYPDMDKLFYRNILLSVHKTIMYKICVYRRGFEGCHDHNDQLRFKFSLPYPPVCNM